MDQRLRELVRQRARGRCEYCGFPEPYSVRPYHCDHVIARQHGGAAELENLAWACNHCNLHKGTNISGLDPATGQPTRLFHPRQDRWDDHFQWHGPLLLGRTVIGRVTVQLLVANDPLLVAVRAALMAEGVFATPFL